MILDLLHQGIRDTKIRVSEAKIAPFVASKLLGQAEKLLAQEEYINYFFQEMVLLEHDLKQGILPMESFWVEVKRIMLS